METPAEPSPAKLSPPAESSTLHDMFYNCAIIINARVMVAKLLARLNRFEEGITFAHAELTGTL